jgi:hypothetical protein
MILYKRLPEEQNAKSFLGTYASSIVVGTASCTLRTLFYCRSEFVIILSLCRHNSTQTHVTARVLHVCGIIRSYSVGRILAFKYYATTSISTRCKVQVLQVLYTVVHSTFWYITRLHSRKRTFCGFIRGHRTRNFCPSVISQFLIDTQPKRTQSTSLY